MSFVIFGFGFFAGCVVLLLCMCAAVAGTKDRDSTDSPDSRSGMELHTDHHTGIQYLSVPGAGLTPRLDEYGKAMRAEDDQ